MYTVVANTIHIASKTKDLLHAITLQSGGFYTRPKTARLPDVLQKGG